MYLNQLVYNKEELEVFYSLVRIISLSENINEIDLIKQNEISSNLLRYSLFRVNKGFGFLRKEIISFNKVFEPKIVGMFKDIFSSDKEDEETTDLQLSEKEIEEIITNYYKNCMTRKEYENLLKSIKEINDNKLPLLTAIDNTNDILSVSIDEVFDSYKEDNEFINNKVLEAIKNNKINPLSFDKDNVKEFLLSLPEVKYKILNKILINVDKIENINSIKLPSDNQKKIFIFNLLLIFSSKESLSPFTMDILNITCQKLDLEIEYINELFDAVQKVSSAIDYAEELIYE